MSHIRTRMVTENESGVVTQIVYEDIFVRVKNHEYIVVTKSATHFAHFLHAKVMPRPFNSNS
jgi:hypothetical protein